VVLHDNSSLSFSRTPARAAVAWPIDAASVARTHHLARPQRGVADAVAGFAPMRAWLSGQPTSTPRAAHEPIDGVGRQWPQALTVPLHRKEIGASVIVRGSGTHASLTSGSSAQQHDLDAGSEPRQTMKALTQP